MNATMRRATMCRMLAACALASGSLRHVKGSSDVRDVVARVGGRRTRDEPAVRWVRASSHRTEQEPARQVREKAGACAGLSRADRIVQSFWIHSTISLRSLSDTLTDAWTEAAFIAATTSARDLPLNFFATSL